MRFLKKEPDTLDPRERHSIYRLTIDVEQRSATIVGSGRARTFSYIRSPESMFHHRFRILTSLLILWQLLLPLSAPWLHKCADDCCAAASDVHQSLGNPDDAPSATVVGSRSCRCDFHRASAGATGSNEDTEQHAPEQKTHDCSNCSICQAISAPRILVAMVEVATSEQFISSLPVPECADPLLGFGLPPQCRAPPRS